MHFWMSDRQPVSEIKVDFPTAVQTVSYMCTYEGRVALMDVWEADCTA